MMPIWASPTSISTWFDEDAEKSPDDEVDLGGDDDLGVDTAQGQDEV